MAEKTEGLHYGAIRMGRRWYATRFIPGGPDNDGDLPDTEGVEFWEAGDWKPYSISAFQERERAAGLLPSAPCNPCNGIGRVPALAQQDQGGGGVGEGGERRWMKRLRRMDSLICSEVADGLQEFDAWLSFRPEFAEVLTAFRRAFGTDTSAATPPPALSGPVIDATEFAEARRDPEVKALLDRAEQYGRELAERGDAAPALSEQGEAGK